MTHIASVSSLIGRSSAHHLHPVDAFAIQLILILVVIVALLMSEVVNRNLHKRLADIFSKTRTTPTCSDRFFSRQLIGLWQTYWDDVAIQFHDFVKLKQADVVFCISGNIIGMRNPPDDIVRPRVGILLIAYDISELGKLCRTLSGVGTMRRR